MRARTASLRPSPAQVYQEMISLPMGKMGSGKKYSPLPTRKLCGMILFSAPCALLLALWGRDYAD